jgi:phage baseplate assembly protein V
MAVDKATLRVIHGAVRGAMGRLKGLVRRATLGQVDSDSEGQTVQTTGHADDVDDAVEYFEQYGFTSVPPSGSEGLVLSVGASRQKSVAICFGDRSVRIRGLGGGEIGIGTAEGAQIILRADGNIEIIGVDGGVVQLGGPTAALAVARETDPVIVPSLTVLQAAIAGWVVVPADGGAALKTALAAWLAADVQDGTIETGGEGATST